MQIENPELKDLMSKLSEDHRRLAELFAQALGEDHVLDCIKRNRGSFLVDGEVKRHSIGSPRSKRNSYS